MPYEDEQKKETKRTDETPENDGLGSGDPLANRRE